MKISKILLGGAVVVAAAATLSSCSEESRLASSLTGEWTGAPQTITDHSVLTASLIETLSIGEPSVASKTSGEMMVNGVVSVTTQLVGDSTFTEPVTVSASAVSAINATWTVVDDDEVLVTFDPATLTVSVDPSAVVFDTTPILGEEGGSRLEQMRPGFCNMIKESVSRTLAAHYSTPRHLDDVKVRKGQTLTFEIGHTDYVFTAVAKQ